MTWLRGKGHIRVTYILAVLLLPVMTLSMAVPVVSGSGEDAAPWISGIVIPGYVPGAGEVTVPFSIQAAAGNLTPGCEYRIKAFVSPAGENKPATQLWNGSSWIYPNSAWGSMPLVAAPGEPGRGIDSTTYPVLHLRMKASYSGYGAIAEAGTAELRLSLKNMSSGKKYDAAPVSVGLLNMPGGDGKNGTEGVLVSGSISLKGEPLGAAPVLFRQGNDSDRGFVAFTLTGDDGVDPVESTGSFRIALPVFDNLSVTVIGNSRIAFQPLTGAPGVLALEGVDLNVTQTLNIGTMPPLREALITEVYFDSYRSDEGDEYIVIHNPVNDTLDIGGWRISDGEAVYEFPHDCNTDGAGACSSTQNITHNSIQNSTYVTQNNIQNITNITTHVPPYSSVIAARSAAALRWTTGLTAHFEWNPDGTGPGNDAGVPDMVKREGGELIFANPGDEVFLYDSYGRLVDAVIYGVSGYEGEGWSGHPVPAVEEGIRLVRNRGHQSVYEQGEKGNEQFDRLGEPGRFENTNTSRDWQHPRIYVVGQSDLPLKRFQLRDAAVTVFAAPDSGLSTLQMFIDSARSSLDICVYEFENLHLMESVKSAAQRGVAVRLLLEGAPVGGITDLERWVAKSLHDAGVEIRFMIDSAGNGIYDRYRYVHSKYAVVDSWKVAVMSENWKDTAFPLAEGAVSADTGSMDTEGTVVVNADPAGVDAVNTDVENMDVPGGEVYGGNRGWGVVVESEELAGYYTGLFDTDFNPAMPDSYAYNESHSMYGAPARDYSNPTSGAHGSHDPGPSVRPYFPVFPAGTLRGDFMITPVIGPEHTLRNDSVIGLLRSAGESVLVEQLQCPLNWGHDLPNLYLKECIHAARRGCEVRILLDSRYVSEDDGKDDNLDTVRYINEQALAENLSSLKARLIYLGNLSKLHNKGVIVDSRAVLVSSINWGPGAVLHNREVGLIIENEEVAAYYTGVFESDWEMRPVTGGSGNGGRQGEGNDSSGMDPMILILMIFITAVWWKKRTEKQA